MVWCVAETPLGAVDRTHPLERHEEEVGAARVADVILRGAKQLRDDELGGVLLVPALVPFVRLFAFGPTPRAPIEERGVRVGAREERLIDGAEALELAIGSEPAPVEVVRQIFR